MNRGLNLPGIQRIMTEFEKESSMMDMKEEMMSDAVDDVMDEEEDEEEEGDKILKEVLDEIGVGLSQQVASLLSLRSSVDQLAAHGRTDRTGNHVGAVGEPTACCFGGDRRSSGTPRRRRQEYWRRWRRQRALWRHV